MANIADAQIIMQFRDIMVERLEDVLMALPALVPQSDEDKRLFKRGMTIIDNLIYELKHAETPRELARYIDVHKVLQDFDEETIHTFKTKLTNSAKNAIDQLSEIARTLQGDGDDEM